MKARLRPPFAIWIALGVKFFGGLLGAARRFPHRYDWRKTVMSSLASPRDNPHGYLLACAGLAGCALLLIPFKAQLERHLGSLAPKWTKAAGRLLLVAAALLCLTAVIVPGGYRVVGIGRLHERLAELFAVAVCLAFGCYLIPIARLPRTHRWLQAATALLIALPLAAWADSRSGVVLAYFSGSHTQFYAASTAAGSTLAFWEWVAAVCIYLFLGLMVLAFS